MADNKSVRGYNNMNQKVSVWHKCLLYLVLALFGIIVIYPISFIILGSFKTNSEIFIEPSKLLPDKFILDNYKQLIQTSEFNVFRLVRNSLMTTAWSIFCTVFIVPTGAYVFARGEFPGKKILFTMFTALMFIHPGAITIYCTFDIVRAVGLTPSLYTKMLLNLFSVPIVGYYMEKGYIDTIPKEMDESAMIDGCGFVRRFFNIIFPLLKPVLATQAIFAFQGSWNDYINTLMWTSSRPQEWTLTVGVRMMQNSGNAAIGMGFTLAAAVISMIPVIIVYCAFNKYIVEGISAGALKG